MKIAINCAFYQPKGGGIKEYIDNLVRQLTELKSNHELIVYVLQDQLEYARKNLPEGLKIKTLPFKTGGIPSKIKRSLLEGKFWRNEEKIEKFDLFHSPFFHAPKLKKAKVVLTVHDLRLYRFPDTYEFFRYQFLKRRVKKSIRSADHIISISNFTKNEIVELCETDPNKITVIHEAINQERFSDKSVAEPSDVPGVIRNHPFLLAVGHMEPRKNYDRLIDAFAKVKSNPELKELQLVIVGKKDHSFETTLKKIEEAHDVHYLSFVEADTLLWLYKNASLFVFPSYYEGFGFPPLEAASLKTISAVSDIPPMREVCGDSVVYFNPYDVSDMAEKIEKAMLSQELREELNGRLQSNLDRFSWRRNGEETMKVYEKMGARK